MGELVSSMVPPRLRRLRRRALFWGLAHRCPVCRASVRRLLGGGTDAPVLRELEVVGAGRTDTGRCPVCFATARTRLLWHWLEQESGLPQEPLHVLHVAPEPGLYWRLSRMRRVAYRPVDLAPGRYGYAGPVSREDLTRLRLPDASVDLVLASHVLEHVRDEAAALAEIRRVLRPGGVAVLQVPLALKLDETLEDERVDSDEARERVYGQSDHVRLYGRDYSRRLEVAGFRVSLYAAPDPVQETWLLDPRERLPIASPA